MGELNVLTTALIRTSGGLVNVDSAVSITELMFDKWCLNYIERLRKFIPDHVCQQCIDIRFENGSILLLVKKSLEFITTNTHLQTRVDGRNQTVNYYQAVVTLLRQPMTPQEQISLKPIYIYGEAFPYSETKNIEFKCFIATSVNGLMNKLTEGRNHGLLFGMGNTCGGGYAMVGIYEDTTTGNTLVYGQSLLQHELPLLETAISDFLTEDSTGANRIWGTDGYKPQKGTDWDVQFVPVMNAPVPCHRRCKNCCHAIKYLVIIHIYQLAGGVFEKTPESYQINDEGDIQQTPFSTWKRKHPPSKTSTTRLIGSQATQSITSPAGSQATQSTTNPAGSHSTQSTTSPAGSHVPQSTTSPAGAHATQSTSSTAGSHVPQSTTSPAGAHATQSTSSTAGSHVPQSTTSPAGAHATQSTSSTAGCQATQSMTSPATVTPQLPENTLSYKQHSSAWTSRAAAIPSTRELSADVVNAFDMFKMNRPMNVTPSGDTLIKNHPNLQSILSILDTEMGESFAIASPSLFQCFNCDVMIPQCPRLVADIMSMNTEGKLLICSVCEEGGSPQEEVEQVTYGNILTRVVKKKLLQIEGKHMDRVVRLYIQTRVYRLTGTNHIPPDDIVTKILSSTTKDVNTIKTRIAHLLLEKQGYLYDAVGEQVSLYFSPRQIAITLNCMKHDISIITGAPGTGKSLVLQELCRMNGRDKSIYVCLNQALAARVKHHNIADVLCVNDSHHLVQHLSNDPLYVNRTLVAIDDAQMMRFSWDQSSISELCGCLQINNLVFALDSKFHNYQQHICELVQLVENEIMETPYQETLHDIYRNTEVVIAYMQSGFPNKMKSKIKSKATLSGDDVRVTAIEDMFKMDQTNGILKHTQELCAPGTNSRGYKPRVVAILVDRGSAHATDATVELLTRLFHKYWSASKPHRAAIYPSQGVIIEALEGFIGIDSSVIICPMWEEAQPNNYRFRCAVASRAITYAEFLQPKINAEEGKLHGLDNVPAGHDKNHRLVSTLL